MAILNIAKKIFGTQNDRELKSIMPIVARINQLEAKIKPLSDAELAAKTPEFRARLERGESLDSILPEAFATVREAAWRVIGQRHYDMQLVGGITLHRGRIAEMRTGEGKTLVSTLPAYLNALSGKGVHIITVNDYLAKRDSAWMGQVHRFLGLSTGIIVHGLTDAQRKVNYACDITYGTNNEFGFDYLRDNMKFRLEEYVQRELNFAVIDEVDSILIDEARTPLIISGPTDDNSELYHKIDSQIRLGGGLDPNVDYTVDEKSKTAALTDAGVDKMESRLGIKNLYDPINIEVLHHVNQGLRAHVLFKIDVDYVVRDGEVMIVDEFTGRLMPGRRWSDGLHQAIEAKEGVNIENENQTLATITFQNYFRMYKKLGGMTGTADTEATEFKQIYSLDVTVIPTNRPMIRQDHADLIFKSQKAKFQAVALEIKRLNEIGQPVLVGTVSVEKSELISQFLKREGIKHNVLNAKQHEREAEIVAQAGRKGAVTIATNMAGRGTDILLGGNAEVIAKGQLGPIKKDFTPEEAAEHQEKLEKLTKELERECAAERDEVKSLGGLVILGTERHESRRIDNQLRGRAGRQGDPGASRFYLSFDDDLLRIFGQSELLKRTVAAMEEDVPIEHKWTTKAIENAQRKVEGHNYDIRKHLLEYDDVMNQQRKVVYAWRREVLARENLKAMVMSMTEELSLNLSEDFFPGGKLRKEDGQARLNIQELNEAVRQILIHPVEVKENEIEPFNNVGLNKLVTRLAHEVYDAKEASFTPPVLRQIEKMVLLTTIDHLWKDHLLAMDHLREGIGLQGYGQKDPLIAYKKEGFKYFQMMMGQISNDVVRKIYAVQLGAEQGFDEEEFEEALTPHLPNVAPAGPSSGNAIQYNIAPDGSLIPLNQALPAGPAEVSIDRVPRNLGVSMQDAAAAAMSKRQPYGASKLQMGSTPRNMQMSGGGQLSSGAPLGGSEYDKVGRNDSCPCGSGKKFKKCHGQ